MKQWILNASPIILLGKIDRLSLVPELNPHFGIPLEVVEEVNCGPDSDRAVQWLTRVDIQTHILDASSIQNEIRLWDLGKGESAVLQNCLNQPHKRVAVVDDLAARKCAKVYQIEFLGTLGILIKAKNANLLSTVRPEIQKVLEAGSNLSENVIQTALQLAQE